MIEYNMLKIKFTNDITFKYVHDLIMDHNPSRIQFIELPDIENVENVFIIAHLLELYNYKVDYITYRTELPTSELTMETFLRGIPFDKIYLNERV